MSSGHKKSSIDPGKLRELLHEVYRGPIKDTKVGFQICCPWHDDQNPSCFVFGHSGVFYCMVCHGDQKKGQRGSNPYRGFLALGMSEARARKLFLDASEQERELDTSRLPSLMSLSDDDTEAKKPVLEEKVVSRAEWPKFWGFRDIDYVTMTAGWFRKRFDPTLIKLKKERLPRIALAVGGAEKYKDTTQAFYLRHEVFLRLSSAVKPKAANSVGLSLDPDIVSPPSASLFGLVNNKVKKDCLGIFFVEGPYDCLRLLQHIYRLPEPYCGRFEVVALLGTPQWYNVLRQFEMFILPGLKDAPIILAFDNDNAGTKVTATAIRNLQDLCYLPTSRLRILSYPQAIKDPGDLSYEDFCSCLRALQLLP